MNRKEAAELLPFIKAFGEGKDIEIRSKNTHAQLNGWVKMNEFIFGNFEYRIKPEPKSEPKYRPFANAKECWQEMQKHQPFGWIKPKDDDIIGKFMLIDSLMDRVVTVRTNVRFKYHELLEHYTFADGTPFGVKEEE